jgi:hypothetical protein
MERTESVRTQRALTYSRVVIILLRFVLHIKGIYSSKLVEHIGCTRKITFWDKIFIQSDVTQQKVATV